MRLGVKACTWMIYWVAFCVKHASQTAVQAAAARRSFAGMPSVLQAASCKRPNPLCRVVGHVDAANRSAELQEADPARVCWPVCTRVSVPLIRRIYSSMDGLAVGSRRQY